MERLLKPGEFIDEERVVFQTEELRHIGFTPDDFVCHVCLDLMERARECVKCHQRMCKTCYRTILSRGGNGQFDCPFRCGSKLYSWAGREFRKALKRLQIKCKNHAYGCNDTFRRYELEDHEKSCDY